MCIRDSLFVIAALVTGAFFLVWTIQRAGSIATLRAMGATKGFLLRDSIGQAVTILAISIVAGALIAVGLGSLLEQTAMPYATEFGSVIGGSLILFVAGLIGALVAVYRVTLSLIHISEPTRRTERSRMPSSA